MTPEQQADLNVECQRITPLELVRVPPIELHRCCLTHGDVYVCAGTVLFVCEQCGSEWRWPQEIQG